MRVEICDLPDNLHSLFEIVGEKGIIEICRLYGGDVLYLPTYKSIVRASRNREINKRFNGVNASQLAREYGITSNHVRRIVN